MASIVGDARTLVETGEPSGTIDERIDGTVVAAQCPVKPDDEYFELLTTLAVNERGAGINGFRIIYSLAEGDGTKRYALTVPWEYVACGSALKDSDSC